MLSSIFARSAPGAESVPAEAGGCAAHVCRLHIIDHHAAVMASLQGRNVPHSDNRGSITLVSCAHKCCCRAVADCASTTIMVALMSCGDNNTLCAARCKCSVAVQDGKEAFVALEARVFALGVAGAAEFGLCTRRTKTERC